MVAANLRAATERRSRSVDLTTMTARRSVATFKLLRACSGDALLGVLGEFGLWAIACAIAAALLAFENETFR